MVEGYSHPLSEVFAEDGDLGVALAEVVQHDEVGVHLHPDVDGLRRRAVTKPRHKPSRAARLLPRTTLSYYHTVSAQTPSAEL